VLAQALRAVVTDALAVPDAPKVVRQLVVTAGGHDN
jgi:hypothetical protein